MTKLSYALFIFVLTLLSGLFPLIKASKDKIKHMPHGCHTHGHLGKEQIIGEALAAGVFLGAGLLHMLHDAHHHFEELGYHYPWAFLLAGAMFLILLLLEHVGQELNENRGSNNLIFVLLSVVMLSFHSLFEGIALGLRNDLSVIIIVFIAIIAHHWASAYSLAIQIRKSNLSNYTNWVLFLIFAIMTPVGVIAGNFLTTDISHNILVPVFTALAAGTFLYIGTLHGLNKAVMVERCCNIYDYVFVIIGFSMMAVVGIWASHH
jgi:zinc transporter ZupT